MNIVWPSLKMLLWLTVLTGLVYSLTVTAIARLVMPVKAQGSLVVVDDKVVGAGLIGQKFTQDKYFWPRPSANDYNPLPSGGSNLGPTSAVLQKLVSERRAHLAKIHQVGPEKVPNELLFASGSGLDPHISPPAAYFQIDRVALARGLARQEVEALVNNMIEKPIPLLGGPYVNVLLINKLLDEMEGIGLTTEAQRSRRAEEEKVHQRGTPK